jgi:hypothetical protein
MFDRIGLFASRMVVGSDNEILVRLWRAGGQGLYTPELKVLSDIEPERLTKRYHRRWHGRHGHFSALMRDEGLERSRYGRFLGVPAWIYRTVLEGAAGWAASSLRTDHDRAFLHETRLRFALGFIRSRWRARRTGEETMDGGGA